MIGLVWKDMLVMRRTLRAYALFLGFYLILAVMGAFDISIVTAMIQVILLMVPISAFSYDEQAKWNRYVMTFPLGRRAVVGGRYLFSLFTAFAASSFGLLVCVFTSLMGRSQLEENLASVLASLGVGLFIVDIMLPLCYKLGPERARPYLYAVVFFPVIALFLAYKLGFQADLSALDRMSAPAVLGLFALVPLAALLGMGISYLVSCRIVADKEF